jgi:hypothetical protein
MTVNTEVIAHIKSYALAHYEEKGTGWHIMVETMEDSEISEHILASGPLPEDLVVQKVVALQRMREYLEPIGQIYDERMAVAGAMARGEW